MKGLRAGELLRRPVLVRGIRLDDQRGVRAVVTGLDDLGRLRLIGLERFAEPRRLGGLARVVLVAVLRHRGLRVGVVGHMRSGADTPRSSRPLRMT